MLKKFVIFLILISLISFTVNNTSSGFFKRYKATKKQITEEAQIKEEKRVLIVEIFASWCPGCKNIQPTLDQLVKESTDISLVQLDVSTPSKAKASAKQAKDLKITDFYNANKSKTATVAIIVPTTLEIITVLQNNNDLDEYKKAIEEAKTKEKSLESPPA